jgi:murein DD-endopeptidase MepM/ murein hydrolase activator NlpD
MQSRKPVSLNVKRSILLLLSLVIAGSFPLTAVAQTTGPIYVVQPGDTLYLIAQRFGTTVDAIASANSITDPSVIVPGSELIIPGYEGVTGTLEFHEVAFGETIHSLSTHFGISEDALIRLNRILHPSRVYIGQALILSVSEEEQATPSFQMLLSEGGESKLAFAARHGVNAWDVSKASHPLNRAWTLPKERLSIPGGEAFLHDLPVPIQKVEVVPTKVLQGRTLTIKITENDSSLVRGFLQNYELSFHKTGSNQLIALQGIYALMEPGMYDLEIQLFNESGDEELFNFYQPLRIASGQYGYDPVLYVPAETVDPEKTSAENELIATITNQVTEEKYWEEALLFPTAYTEAFPSYFGSRRNYNDQGYNWYHTGLDLYGGVGTPITSPANGRVVFVGELEVRGNVTFIDHGWGVFTGYLHQSAIEVEKGDWVEAGQLIGYVGETGRVTGPHLHWEVWVGGVPVDPLEWTSGVFP